METEIRYLRTLELDLARAAAWAQDGLEPGDGRPARGRRPDGGRTRGRWPVWTATAAAFLLGAWVIGSMLSGGLSAERSSFEQVGQAVDGTGSADGGVAGVPDEPAPALARDVHGLNSFGGASGTPAPIAPHSSGGQTSPAAQDLSKIARDGAISVEVPDGDFGATFQKAVDIAQRNGGMVLSSSTEGSGAGTLTLRIPAAHFDDAFVAVSQLGTVLSSSTKGQDVTAQYVDVQAHLKILKVRRDFLFGLYQRVTTISQSLQLHSRLEDVQLQIDQLQGQIRFLDNQVDESTLKVDVREKNAPVNQQQTSDDIRTPSLGRAWDRALQGFVGVIATLVVGLGYLVPIGLIAGLVLLVLTRVRRRDRAAS